MSNLWPDIMRRLLGTAVAVAIAAGVVPLAWFIFNFAFPEVIPLDFGSASFWLAELRWTMALGIGAAAFWGWFENNEPSFGVCRDLEFRAKHTTVLKKGLPEWVKFVDTRFFYATTHLTFLVVVPAVILAA